MIAYHEILSALHGSHVQNPYAQLWGTRLCGEREQEQEIYGSVPITFRGYGQNLKDYRIYGSTVSAAGVGEYDSELNGYKIPVTVTNGTESVTISVYIGSEPLYADEYISFSEQKIYRNVSDILTPSDPPVPLPALPALSGTDILSAGTEIQPAEIFLKGKISSIATHTLTDSSSNILADKNRYTLVTKE
ncbi:MAG: hypothetical protein IJ642_09660 [Oscillospiraceae bacterium]|nr:hypothetical protein [Oscillospiraceae bacterium]